MKVLLEVCILFFSFYKKIYKILLDTTKVFQTKSTFMKWFLSKNVTLELSLLRLNAFRMLFIISHKLWEVNEINLLIKIYFSDFLLSKKVVESVTKLLVTFVEKILVWNFFFFFRYGSEQIWGKVEKFVDCQWVYSFKSHSYSCKLIQMF